MKSVADREISVALKNPSGLWSSINISLSGSIFLKNNFAVYLLISKLELSMMSKIFE